MRSEMYGSLIHLTICKNCWLTSSLWIVECIHWKQQLQLNLIKQYQAKIIRPLNYSHFPCKTNISFWISLCSFRIKIWVEQSVIAWNDYEFLLQCNLQFVIMTFLDRGKYDELFPTFFIKRSDRILKCISFIK